MTTLYKQLKSAATELRKQAAAVEAAEADLHTKVAAATASASNAVKAAEQTKTAADLSKADLAAVAKTAAASIKKAGLLSSDDQADKFASLIANDHKVALTKLSELAGRIPAAKLGSVVADGRGSATPVTADESYDAKAAAHLRRMNLQ